MSGVTLDKYFRATTASSSNANKEPHQLVKSMKQLGKAVQQLNFDNLDDDEEQKSGCPVIETYIRQQPLGLKSYSTKTLLSNTVVERQMGKPLPFRTQLSQNEILQ